MHKFAISDEAFEYLVIQRGEISDYRHDRGVWEHHYNESINAIYENIKDHLPTRMVNSLDIGGGLSGITALVSQHYNKPLHCAILDGIDDAPIVKKHATTFNNLSVAERFLKANGVKMVANHNPHRGMTYNLITSFASYCFHIHPNEYLDVVKGQLSTNGVAIFEVRRNPQWEQLLAKELGDSTIIYEASKLTRRVYHANNFRRR
jgi:hypothetical protein